MKKLLALFLVLAAGVGGIYGGQALKPAEDDAEAHARADLAEPLPTTESQDAAYEYVKFSRQFILPVVESSKIKSLIVADIQLEVTSGSTEYTFSRAPKLRAAFLQVLYRHAHTGSLKQSILTDRTLRELREDLLKVARPILGDRIRDILITDLLRQDR